MDTHVQTTNAAAQQTHPAAVLPPTPQAPRLAMHASACLPAGLLAAPKDTTVPEDTKPQTPTLHQPTPHMTSTAPMLLSGLTAVTSHPAAVAALACCAQLHPAMRPQTRLTQLLAGLPAQPVSHSADSLLIAAAAALNTHHQPCSSPTLPRDGPIQPKILAASMQPCCYAAASCKSCPSLPPVHCYHHPSPPPPACLDSPWRQQPQPSPQRPSSGPAPRRSAAGTTA